ncbi:unnamed protein product [Brassica oleracea]
MLNHDLLAFVALEQQRKYIKCQTTKFLLFKLYGNEIYIHTSSNKCQRSENYKNYYIY